MTTIGLVALYFLTINFLTYFAFFHDKRQAIKHGWRVRESTLLGLALAGGSPFAKLAQHAFRHKTRKKPFARLLNAILVVQLVATIAFSIPALRHAAVGTASVFATAVAPPEPSPRKYRTWPRRFGPGSDLRP